MAIRVRSNGAMICAAMSDPELGDTYIDDGLHYELSVVRGVICTYPMPMHKDKGGLWFWSGSAPDGCDTQFTRNRH